MAPESLGHAPPAGAPQAAGAGCGENAPVEIPLFPLHTVLAPGIALPLHIFEERYRLMVGRCLEASLPFGVVLIRQGREVAGPDGEGAMELSIADIGTFAEIREASRYPDGRYDILTVGAGRFTVRDIVSDREPYLVGVVDPLEDEAGDPAVEDALAQRVSRRFVDYLRLMQPRDGEQAEPIDVQMEVEVDAEDAEAEDAEARVPRVRFAADDDDEDDEDDEDEEGIGSPADLAAALHIPDDPATLSFLLAGIIQVEVERKQALLEAASAEERLRALDELLSREIILLGRRLAPYAPDRSLAAVRAN
jgi:Lon protease-like protein